MLTVFRVRKMQIKAVLRCRFQPSCWQSSDRCQRLPLGGCRGRGPRALLGGCRGRGPRALRVGGCRERRPACLAGRLQGKKARMPCTWEAAGKEGPHALRVGGCRERRHACLARGSEYSCGPCYGLSVNDRQTYHAYYPLTHCSPSLTLSYRVAHLQNDT